MLQQALAGLLVASAAACACAATADPERPALQPPAFQSSAPQSSALLSSADEPSDRVRAQAAPAPASTGTGTWPHVWLSPGIYSWHFDQSKGLRNDNVGASVQVDLAPEHGFLAGTYINSNRARTHYGAYAWRPLQWQWGGVDVGVGAAIGAFDGYPNYRNGGWFVAPLPVASIEGRYLGANLILIPTIANRLDGALGIQLRLRVW